VTARTPDECAVLARMLMEQAETALVESVGGQGRDLYDRLVAAAQVWATLSTRPTDLEPITATLDSMAPARLSRGSLVVMAKRDGARLTLQADALGTVSEVVLTDGEPEQYDVVWHDSVGVLRHHGRELVALAFP